MDDKIKLEPYKSDLEKAAPNFREVGSCINCRYCTNRGPGINGWFCLMFHEWIGSLTYASVMVCDKREVYR